MVWLFCLVLLLGSMVWLVIYWLIGGCWGRVLYLYW